MLRTRSVLTLALLALPAAGAVAHANPAASASRARHVELDDNYFKPKVIKGTAGHRVTLELENEGKAEHNFTIKGKVDKDIEPGHEVKVTVRIPKSGKVAFFCEYHRALGMKGVLKPR